MPDDTSKTSSKPAAANRLTAAIVGGAVIVAAVGTVLPELIGIEGTPALALRLVFYAVAAIDVAIAFWLRGRISKAQQAGDGDGNTVRRMR